MLGFLCGAEVWTQISMLRWLNGILSCSQFDLLHFPIFLGENTSSAARADVLEVFTCSHATFVITAREHSYR